MLSNCFALNTANATIVTSEHTSKKDSPMSNPIFFHGIVKSNGVIGSAYIEYLGCKVICALIEPKLSIRTNNINNVGSFDNGSFECIVTFSSSLKPKLQNNRESDYNNSEKFLSKATTDALISSINLSKYPKANLVMFMQVLDASCISGSNQSTDIDEILTVAINGGSLALLDANVEMYDIVSSYLLKNKQTPDSSSSNDTSLLVSSMSSTDQITFLSISGRLDPVPLIQATQFA
eukprot:gene11109-14911_t